MKNPTKNVKDMNALYHLIAHTLRTARRSPLTFHALNLVVKWKLLVKHVLNVFERPFFGRSALRTRPIQVGVPEQLTFALLIPAVVESTS